jgi:ribulose-phosphate 3-epimerase
MQPAVDPSDVIIAPTLLTADANEFTKLIGLFPTFAKRMQIDVVDGSFVSTTTIPESAITALPTNIPVDLHMMVARPSEHLPHILRLKPNLCIFHAEATEDLLPIFAQLKQAGIKAGVALLQRTYPGEVEQYIKAADHVLIFAGALGKNGGIADLLQVEKVKLIRNINPEVEIGWDGGVSMDNVRTLAHSNMNVLNAGSSIAKTDDPKKAWEELMNEKTQRGVKI